MAVSVFADRISSPASPLFPACAFGLLEILVWLEVIETLKWHHRNELSATGVHVAARHGYPDVIGFLLQKGVKVDAKTRSGETALHLAAQHGHIWTMKLLLAEGAQVVDEDEDGWTVLDIAMKLRDEDMVLPLLQKGAKAEALAKYREKVACWHDLRSHGTLKLCNLLGRPTGYVGILNEGQTGFLNTALQLLNMLRPIHEVINQCETGSGDGTSLNIALTLCELFKIMATKNDVESARELTQAFGWGSRQLNEAQDAMNMLDRLLAHLAGTKTYG
ncbi:MAG: hypothetical protein Q9163_003483, partial [Psora crenata]